MDMKKANTERGREIIDIIEEINPDAVVFSDEEFITALIGYTDDGRAVYDFNEMVNFLVDRDGMDRLDAADYIDYNTVRALPYYGITPLLLLTLYKNERGVTTWLIFTVRTLNTPENHQEMSAL